MTLSQVKAVIRVHELDKYVVVQSAECIVRRISESRKYTLSCTADVDKNVMVIAFESSSSTQAFRQLALIVALWKAARDITCREAN